MKKKPFYLFLILAAIVLSLSSCLKKQSFSEIPEIGYMGTELVFGTGQDAKELVFSISYQDGNGDIGLGPGDTLGAFEKKGPYYYNFVINYYQKINGVFQQLNDSVPFSARIPVLTPDDPGKAIKGYIIDTIKLILPLHDTIRLDAFIYDRALHKSNVITTPEIVLRRR